MNSNELKIKEGVKERILGISIIAVAIIIVVVLVAVLNGGNGAKLKDVYIAAGGGKENFLADEDVKEIMKKHGLNPVVDNWSNGKTITAPLVREYVKEGNKNVPSSDLSVNNDKCTKYDVLFTSDERYYNAYKTSATSKEAERYRVLDGSLTLNTPIVIYSWKQVSSALEKEGIVTVRDGVSYITNMDKLLDYIYQGKSWTDIGLDIYGKINIGSTDPVSSSPGTTYYGLLMKILTKGDTSEEAFDAALPKLKEFYQKSGYMNHTPADLFQMYLKQGMGSKPMIVDYEKSIAELKTTNEAAFNAVKDDIVILYPEPTVWNSHCIATFSENGNLYLKAYDDPELQEVAWNKYGFRVGVGGSGFNVSGAGINGIPQTISKVAGSLKMDEYDKIVEELSK